MSKIELSPMSGAKRSLGNLEIPLHEPSAAPVRGPRVMMLAGVAAVACASGFGLGCATMRTPESMPKSAAVLADATAEARADAAAARAVVAAVGLSVPAYNDPVFIAGHMPALWVYRTPTKEVRVEGSNIAPSNSIEISLTGKSSGHGQEPRFMFVYAQAYETTGVELRMPTYFLPNDRRVLEVVHQGRIVHSCEVPSDAVCKYDFGPEDTGKRFTVKAFEAESGKLLQLERVYTPLPYMCAASTYSRVDVPSMDCSPVEVPKSVLDLSATSQRGFAIEIEFAARDTALTEAVYGPEALAKVRGCVNAKLAGNALQLEGRWHWEEEDSTIPFTARDVSDAGEYGGWNVELTSPGPPEVLLGQTGMDDVAGVFSMLHHMGTQVGLWAQFHVHVNALSRKAHPDGSCCLSSDEISNVWAAWAQYQAVIDEMQSSTNVDVQWALPLYLEDPIVGQVFANMHGAHGTDLDAADACEAFYGPGACDGAEHGYRPPNAEPGSTAYQHSPQRYYAVNLAPLTGKGTIEFRQQAGTHNAERAQRWAQFVLAFVETFKDDASFFGDSLAQDVVSMQHAQEQASLSGLFARLGVRVDAGTESYYAERKWTTASPAYTEADPRCLKQ